MFMNRYEIEQAVVRHANHPVLSKAAHFLQAFMEEVDAHSDGWAYWRAPVHAANKLCNLLQEPRDYPGALAAYKHALTPIKSFMTRHGVKAGMIMPSTGV